MAASGTRIVGAPRASEISGKHISIKTRCGTEQESKTVGSRFHTSTMGEPEHNERLTEKRSERDICKDSPRTASGCQRIPSFTAEKTFCESSISDVFLTANTR